MAKPFADRFQVWKLAKYSRRHNLHGKVRMSSGPIRRDCLNRVIVLGEKSPGRMLRSYIEYYHNSRCHLGLNKDSPETREVQRPDLGVVVDIPKVEGLHHRFERCAARSLAYCFLQNRLHSGLTCRSPLKAWSLLTEFNPVDQIGVLLGSPICPYVSYRRSWIHWIDLWQ